MRFLPIVLVCAFTASARADFGIGASVGTEDATILFPIRLSSVIVEPSLGYYDRDIEPRAVSAEGRSIGVGVFGLSTAGDNLSIYYGARLADLSDESSSALLDPFTALPVGQTRTEVDGYLVAPTVGFQYAISRVVIGAEIGWEYRDVDQEGSTTITNGGVTLPLSTTRSSTVARGTHATIVFRYFF